MSVRAVRGATCLAQDSPDEMREAVGELLLRMMSANDISPADLISLVLTSTPDLVSDFPAAAVRACGVTDVPMLCATEIDVAGALPRVVRIMAHVDTDIPREKIEHIYLRGAQVLRQDLQR
jgi:chorismate mutase